jgi:hypothetical protein
MSAASEPAPRAKSPTDTRPTVSRYTLFVPMLILLLGSGALSSYQVLSMEEQLDQMTETIDKYDGKVKVAQYEKDKFYHMARAVLRLAPKDANANQVATLFNLRELQRDQPDLMNANDPSDLAGVTNIAPTEAAPLTNSTLAPTSLSTNAAPAKATAPATK